MNQVERGNDPEKDLSDSELSLDSDNNQIDNEESSQIENEEKCETGLREPIEALNGIEDEEQNIITSRAGRVVKRINYKTLSRHGLQFMQDVKHITGTKNNNKDNDMFKTINEITMATLEKSTEYDQMGVSQGIK